MAVQAIYESLALSEKENLSQDFSGVAVALLPGRHGNFESFLFYLWHLNAAKEISGIYFVKIVSESGMRPFSAR